MNERIAKTVKVKRMMNCLLFIVLYMFSVVVVLCCGGCMKTPSSSLVFIVKKHLVQNLCVGAAISRGAW